MAIKMDIAVMLIRALNKHALHRGGYKFRTEGRQLGASKELTHVTTHVAAHSPTHG